MGVELHCEQFIQEGEKLEKKLYLFLLLQLGNRAAASEILTEAFVSCYRSGFDQGNPNALEMAVFRAAFELSRSADYAMRERTEHILPDPGLYTRLVGLSTIERATVILMFFSRFTTRDAADILGVSVGRVRDWSLRWIESLCP